MSLLNKRSQNLNNSTESFSSSLTGHRKASHAKGSKRRSEKSARDHAQVNQAPVELKDPIPQNYCVNIFVDGAQHMDRTSHFGGDQVGSSLCLEHRMRPISGVRNHLRRNIGSSQQIDIMKNTDLLDRIGSLKHLKFLDLSHNGLKKFPAKLCDLNLSTLNLTDNQLDENEFPLEAEKYQNLIELTLDKNNFKHFPKVIGKLKNLERLSAQNNSLVDLKNVHSLRKLKYLILDSNNLTGLEEKMARLQNLEILHLGHNFIVDLDANIMKTNMNKLKQLDLSFNKLTTVAIEVFMLPHLEMLNLSNNKINILPIIPTSYFRTIPIWLCDLSSNNLIRFYEFLLTICDNIDLTSNRIKTIPMKAFDKLTAAQLNKKVLKIEQNPLHDPPIEFCKYGLNVMKNYFDEEMKHVQLNKGCKLIFLGDNGVGKTMLAHALEDHYSQTNFTEQFTNQGNLEKESKLVEIHEFFIKNSQDLPSSGNTSVKSKTLTFNTISAPPTRSEASTSYLSMGKLVKTKKSTLNSSQASLNSEETKSGNFGNFNNNLDELNAFSNNLLMKDQKIKNSSRMPITIYDFNGSLAQFQHLTELFLDKNALIVIVIDAADVQTDTVDSDGTVKWSSYLKRLLDMISLKMTKNNTYILLPVLTKWDKVHNPRNKPDIDHAIVKKVEQLLQSHLRSRLDDIKAELKLIELLPNISASQSDRLKHLVNTQNNLTPVIYSQFQRVSSTKNKGIDSLAQTIQDIILDDQKRFPSVNTKVPTFWSEVERFSTTTLSQLPKTKFVNNNLQISQASMDTQMSMLTVEYEHYKRSIIEKYGMSHLIESITKYFSTSGKIIWFHDQTKKREKVFLRPSILFDLFFVLYRTKFSDNFLEDHVATLRSKLIKEPVKELDTLISDLLTKGLMSMELLKLIWCPILITNSPELIREVLLLFTSYFNICYPDLSKEKLRLLFCAREVTKENMETFRTLESASIVEMSELSFTSTKFTQVVVPFYLPEMTDVYELNKVREGMSLQNRMAVDFALTRNIKKEKPMYLGRLAHKYVFPWGLMAGVFERFSVNCVINSDVYYKYHYKNFIQAYSEDNSIGVMIYTNSVFGPKEAHQTKDEVTFEFYLLSYSEIVKQLEMDINVDRDEDDNNGVFDHNLTMDLDHLWSSALKILGLFEEGINQSYPGLRFDRCSMCPSCELFSFLGEWNTPKELQKNKMKSCTSCEETIDYAFLVKPTTGQNTAIDVGKLRQRLNNLAEFKIQTARNLKLIEKMKQPVYLK